MTPTELEQVRSRWIDEVYNNAFRVDPSDEYTWEGLLVGFLLGAGVPLRQALEVRRRAPSKEWPLA